MRNKSGLPLNKKLNNQNIKKKYYRKQKFLSKYGNRNTTCSYWLTKHHKYTNKNTTRAYHGPSL